MTLDVIVNLKDKIIKLDESIIIDESINGYFILDAVNVCNEEDLNIIPAFYIETADNIQLYKILMSEVILGRRTDII